MKKVILLSALIVFGLTSFWVYTAMAAETTGEYIDDSAITAKVDAIIVKDPDAQYFKIKVTTTQGDVVLQGFVNSRQTEERLVAKIKDLKGVKSVKSLLKLQEKK